MLSIKMVLGLTENESKETSDKSCCNHGHGEPDKTYYHEDKNVIEETWTFKARDTYNCDSCDAEVTATRELGKIAIDDDENLVIQNE